VLAIGSPLALIHRTAGISQCNGSKLAIDSYVPLFQTMSPLPGNSGWTFGFKLGIGEGSGINSQIYTRSWVALWVCLFCDPF